MTAIPDIPPALILMLGACLVPLLRGSLKNAYLIALSAAAFFWISQMPDGSGWKVPFLGQELVLLRIDAFSRPFGYIFTLNALAVSIYSFYLKDDTQHVPALLYIGSALGVVFAGDLISLYLFWEGMAIASVFLVLARRTPKAMGAGQRYILVHIVGGLVLLAGILLVVAQTGSIAFNGFAPAEGRSLGMWLILIGFLVNAAAPPFSAWLPDAYPEATVTGGVLLSAYTSKTAVYALLRGFAGWEILIAIGGLMAIYGIIYALLENDMRRILAYSIINQVGFMVCGIGIGTELALNGAIAHAFCHIIYKSLLWMSAGAVLYQTGKSKCTELGGLYKTMPWTLLLGLVGALSISSVPLTNGFTSKSLIISAAGEAHLFWAWLVLEIASAGVFLHAGIKFPYFVFFAKDSGLRPKDPQLSMLLGMGLLAGLCLLLGVYPQPLYAILPFAIPYQAFTAEHVIAQVQLLTFSALVFFWCLPLLKRTNTIVLDSDWFYRKSAVWGYRLLQGTWGGLDRVKQALLSPLAASADKLLKFGSAQILLAVMLPYWKVKGVDAQRLAILQHDFRAQVRLGNFPMGITALFSVIFLAVFFYLGVAFR